MGGTDKHNRLSEEVLAFQSNKAGKVFITWQGKQVKILQGSAAQKFLAKIDGLDKRNVQLVMAKATGNFKHGNER